MFVQQALEACCPSALPDGPTGRSIWRDLAHDLRGLSAPFAITTTNGGGVPEPLIAACVRLMTRLSESEGGTHSVVHFAAHMLATLLQFPPRGENDQRSAVPMLPQGVTPHVVAHVQKASWEGDDAAVLRSCPTAEATQSSPITFDHSCDDLISGLREVVEREDNAERSLVLPPPAVGVRMTPPVGRLHDDPIMCLSSLLVVPHHHLHHQH